MSDPPKEDKRFKDAFAKQLADALIQNEQFQKEALTSSSKSFKKQEIEDAYLELCYDDPILKNDSICRELSLQLLSYFPHKSNSTSVPVGGTFRPKRGISVGLGLSDRFVNGLLESTSNSRNQTTQKTTSPSQTRGGEQDYTKTYNGEQIVSEPAASSRGYSELSFALFGMGPLYCCLALREVKGDTDVAKILKPVREFLGTYNGKDNDEQSHQDDHAVEVATNKFLEAMTIDPNQGGQESKFYAADADADASNENNDGDSNDDEDSMKEIFAADSDPDDFDYGDERYNVNDDNTSKLSQDFIALGQGMSVKTLCQSTLLTKNEVVLRVKTLLSELTYRRITMGTKNWKEWDVSNTLVQLTLNLLQCLGDDDLDGLGMMYNSPLVALRDRAIDENYGHDALESYLDLIHQLLKSKSSDVGTFSSSNRDEFKELSPVRAIGMSALASLCSSLEFSGITKKKLRTSIRVMIMKCLDEFIDCVEFVRPKKKELLTVSPGSLPSWVRIAMALSQILDFVTGLKGGSNFGAIEESLSSPVSNIEAQSMLQSGFFRAIILLYTHTEFSDESNIKRPQYAIDSARQHLLRQIFVVSGQSQILAKYASRVPELTNILYSDRFQTNNTVDTILWYSLLSKLKSSAGGRVAIVMKGVVSMTSSDLNEKCMSSFNNLCNETTKCMVAADTDDGLQQFQDFVRFTNCLCHMPYITECWISIISSMGKKNLVTDSVSKIIRSLPKAQSKTAPQDNKKSETDKPPRETVDASTKASIRKGCKSILLYIENSESPTFSRISSKTD